MKELAQDTPPRMFRASPIYYDNNNPPRICTIQLLLHTHGCAQYSHLHHDPTQIASMTLQWIKIIPAALSDAMYFKLYLRTTPRATPTTATHIPARPISATTVTDTAMPATATAATTIIPTFMAATTITATTTVATTLGAATTLATTTPTTTNTIHPTYASFFMISTIITNSPWVSISSQTLTQLSRDFISNSLVE